MALRHAVLLDRHVVSRTSNDKYLECSFEQLPPTQAIVTG